MILFREGDLNPKKTPPPPTPIPLATSFALDELEWSIIKGYVSKFSVQQVD